MLSSNEKVQAAALFNELMGVEAVDVPKPFQGQIYFVEGNSGSNENDGSDWEHAFRTLTYALAISHTNIDADQKGWASRNTIYCKGDALKEDLILLADKTDIIGVGSCNANPYCRLTGNHVIPTQAMGCHFYNMEFWSKTDSGIIFKSTSNGGLEFHNCRFIVSKSQTIGLQLVKPDYVKVIDCKFYPLWNVGTKFSTAAIDILAGVGTECEIVGCTIYGEKGITIHNSTFYACMIKNNFIYAEGLVIEDLSDDWMIIDNRWICIGEYTKDSIDYNRYLACGNIGTGKMAGDKSTFFPDTQLALI